MSLIQVKGKKAGCGMTHGFIATARQQSSPFGAENPNRGLTRSLRISPPGINGGVTIKAGLPDLNQRYVDGQWKTEAGETQC